ncbi:MAG: CehA/McbA family metallohydrolase [Planctomycetota bacterium]|nr:CehA/McbA family metallohydrolase [Planctomycetota bacterium]
MSKATLDQTDKMLPSSLSQALYAVVGFCLFAFSNPHRVVAQGSVDMEFVDSASGEPILARMMFTKSTRKVARPKKLLFSGDQWLAEPKFPLSVANGDFEFIVRRGPEFTEIRGGFTIEPRAKDVVLVEVPRAIDMHAEHWYSGDHLSSLPIGSLSRWQQADAVDLVVSVAAPEEPQAAAAKQTKPSKSKDRVEEVKVNNAESLGLKLNTRSRLLDWQHGSILLHREPPTAQPAQAANQPSSKQGALPESATMTAALAFELLDTAKRTEGVIPELVRLWDRDVPILLGNESIRSVQLLSNFNRPNSDDRLMLASEKGSKTLRGKIQITRGKERIASELFAPIGAEEELKFKDARGVGRLNEYLYWQMLEAGLRLTPTASSDFAVNETHVGYNRVYIYSEEQPTEATWWQAISQGRTVVTNGPLLRAIVNAMPPGSVQSSYRGQSIPIDIGVSLSVREPVDYLDVIFNGETMYSAKLEDHYKRGEFPPMEIDQSGWLVIRVITAHEKGYRLATTAPFYFEFDGKPRVSRRAVDFFEDWLAKSKAAIAAVPKELEQMRPWIADAEQFWKRCRVESNVE